MENSCIQLDDLPDEILLILLKKLHNLDVLYSLIGINKRLDTVVNDLSFTKHLTLILPVNERFYSLVNDSIYTENLTLTKTPVDLFKLSNSILDRFCLEILPKINHKIERLDVESSSMDRILQAAQYPKLHTLKLYDVAPEVADDIFSDESYLIRHFQHQISSILINMKWGALRKNFFGLTNINIFILKRICNKFKNLKYLNFTSSSDFEQLTFDNSPSIEFCSNLLELHVIVKTVGDCLCLLDGHFNQLHTFHVRICPVHVVGWPLVNNHKELPSLKCFSLIHEYELHLYKQIIIPLLQRMSNLEELNLYFVSSYGPMIDGDHLKMNIINHMSKLNKFTFNISSIMRVNNEVNLPSNEDIQNTFRNFQNNQIISNVGYFLKGDLFYCHIYSCPYTWTFYHNIRNHFPDGLFKCVREISLRDERPFEYEFFLRIAQSFPFIRKLSLYNREPQENDNLQELIIEYPHLIHLDLRGAHENYVEQFLNDTKTCLSKNIYLLVHYDYLQNVTNNFTRDATRINCSKIIGIKVLDYTADLRKSRDYFPYAEIY